MESEMRFSDPLDQAADLTDRTNQAAIEEHRHRMKPEQVKVVVDVVDGVEVMDWPIKECINEDCGEPIEPQRLEMGKVRCFACQSLKEERDAKYGKR